MKFKLLLITLALPAIAMADATSTDELQTLEEQRLLSLFETGRENGINNPQLAALTQDLPPVAPSPSPTPKLNTSQMLEKLANEVDSLRAKNEVIRYTSLSTQRPKASKTIGSKTCYSYQEGDIYELRAGVDRVTDIELQPGEDLTTPPVAGDTVRWKIGILQSGKAQAKQTHVVVKPLDTGIETNILITTSRRVYHIRAVAGDWYMPSIAWHYPDDEEAALAAAVLRSEEEEVISIPPEELRFEYEIDGDDYPWKPLRIFDDGLKTYIQMPKALRVSDAPALFVIEDGEPMLVNYRVKGDYYIVDRLFEEAQLRVGIKKKIQIYDRAHKKSFFRRIFE